MLIKHAGWKEMKGKFAVVVNNGMSCITSALKAYNNVRLLGKHIRNLALAFIAPVSTYNCSDHTINPPSGIFPSMLIICLMPYSEFNTNPKKTVLTLLHRSS